MDNDIERQKKLEADSVRDGLRLHPFMPNQRL
jgi:hypothetical protein